MQPRSVGEAFGTNHIAVLEHDHAAEIAFLRLLREKRVCDAKYMLRISRRQREKRIALTVAAHDDRAQHGNHCRGPGCREPDSFHVHNVSAIHGVRESRYVSWRLIRR